MYRFVVALAVISIVLCTTAAHAQRIELVREQVWGAGEEHPPFAQLATLLPGPSGDAWVLEGSSGQLYHLLANGDVEGPIGRKGEAPGEWNLATSLLWLPPHGPVVLGVMPPVLAAPLTQTNLPLPGGDEMGTTFTGQAKAHAGRIFMEWSEVSLNALPPVIYRELLSFVPGEEATPIVYRRSELQFDMSDPLAFGKKIMPWNWTLLEDGRVVMLGAGPRLQLSELGEDSSEKLFLDEEVEPQAWPEGYLDGTMAAMGSAGLSSEDLKTMMGDAMDYMPPALQLYAYGDGLLLLDSRDFGAPPEGVDLRLRQFDASLNEIEAVELLLPGGKLGVSDALFPAEGGWWLIENQSEEFEGVVVSWLVDGGSE